MKATTVRIKDTVRATLKDLARREAASMQAVLERAIEEYRRRRFLEDVNAGYAALRVSEDSWAEVQAERDLWDAALADGLPLGDVWESRAKKGTSRRRTRRR